MIGFLSNVNVEPIQRFFAGEKLYFSPYGQFRQDLLDPTSPLRQPELDSVVLFLDGGEFCGDTLHRLPTADARRAVRAELEALLGAVGDFAAERGEVLITIAEIVLPPTRFTTFLDANSDLGFGGLEDELNQMVREFARARPNVLVLDWRRVVALHGYANLTTASFWYLGRIKLNQRALELLATGCRRLWDAYAGRTKKVLVVDLDNTLWGGVVGDLGPMSVELSEDGLGKAYRDLQRAIRALRDVGVLLAINSKNTESVVREIFATNPMMVLAWDDFVATRINWRDKAGNLVELAEQLDLGVDSFVFIDDSPAERALVREMVPGVAIPEFPADPADLPAWFMETVVEAWFPRVALTDSDRSKTTQYQARGQRLELRSKLGVDAFLRELDIRLTIRVDAKEHRARIAQLTQKTNQFNMTTQRLTEKDVQAVLDAPGQRVFTLEYEDRFGKEGVVGVGFCSTQARRIVVDNLILSCRVLGRSVEHALLRSMLEAAGDGSGEIEAPFVPTQRNAVAAGFYAACGMRAEEGGVHRGACREVLETLKARILVQEVTVHGA